ncbi:MAG: hypothetical protein U9Q03_01315 [Patescibacteria group bacterium]|nr:hypothetical protein [Patescibacteria group bacterium]
MNHDGKVVLAPLEAFSGTVVEFRDLLGSHFGRGGWNPELPQNWPFPHDTRKTDLQVMSDDRVTLGPVEIDDDGLVHRSVEIETDDERTRCVAVFGRVFGRKYARDGYTWTRVIPCDVADWQRAGETVMSLCPAGTKKSEVVVLAKIFDATFDWNSLDEPPHDLCESTEPDDDDPMADFPDGHW